MSHYAEVVIIRTSADKPQIEALEEWRPRPYCDATRPDWQDTWKRWTERKQLTIYLCHDDAAIYGFKR
jgi:hypothetical protein